MSTPENTPLPTTAMLGVGSMGGAILHGLLTPEVKIELPIRVTTKSVGSAQNVSTAAGVLARASDDDEQANQTAVRGAKVVIIGVKPFMVHDLLREIASSLDSGTVVISVAAGVTLQSMQELLPDDVSVIRAMPNTPSLVGKGITGITANPDAPAQSLALAQQLFETVGKVLVLDSEEQLDALSSVSGSGPAYVFLFIEELTAAAVRLGFTQDEAKTMVEQTFLGASLLLDHKQEDPAELRRRVTSPQGTTEQAIKQFQASGLDAIMDRALAAAITRSQELAAGK